MICYKIITHKNLEEFQKQIEVLLNTGQDNYGDGGWKLQGPLIISNPPKYTQALTKGY